jgi:type II secretory ATPase GspE/PulE/Tfp pilus assembly ATPase PilB-like protein
LLARLGPLFEHGRITASRGKGCAKCHDTGYHGRLGIYEVLVPDENMRHLIASGASILEMTQMARQIGATPMIEDAREKVNAGLTTLEEVLRVLGPQ